MPSCRTSLAFGERKLCSSSKQISRCMIERGHDQDTLQCRVKVKELRNAYHKAWDANCCSSAAPTSCRFYKELDVILGGDPTSTVKAPGDTSLAHVPVESGPSQEVEILDKSGEGDPEAEDDLKARDVCSQLFPTMEGPSQSQQSELGKAQTGEEAPEMTLGSQPPLSAAERLRRIRKHRRRTKEDFLHEVMMHSAAEKQELKEWWDS
ncbi:stonin-1 isoform X4 [Mauremys mutica]|uniref:stonin-1 isoform X4 n=1 Tax=Mauremys mutica TaxID=74926 RepID=UPI001D16E0BE|nr:stonin-1 isoform X4 [Mauremys mutica]